MNIGQPNWTNDDLRSTIKEFYDLYMTRPIKNNRGGMMSAHLFPTWFLIKHLNPKCIIESGVFLGQGTYFMEQAAPDACFWSLEPRPQQIQWKSTKVLYDKRDFANIRWQRGGNIFTHFDDHQNAFSRIQQMKLNGFKYAMFEDNYPTGLGDCYSLKKCFSENGLEAQYLKDSIKTYYEFPPIFKLPQTRFGTPWGDYDTPDPLYEKDGEGYESWMDLFIGEANSYTWICYVELK